MSIPYDIPSLSGGVSQQPPHLRLPSQVADADNVVFSTAEGARKRSGTEFVATVPTADPNSWSRPALSGNNFRLHAVERDGDERYLVLYGDSTLRVFAEDGSEASIADDAGGIAAAYLDANSAGHNDLKVRSYADTIFVVNTTVAVSGLTSGDYTVEQSFPTPADVFSYTGTAADIYAHAASDDDADLAGYFRYTLDDALDISYSRIDFPTVTGSEALPKGTWDNAAEQGFTIAVRRLKEAGFTGATYTTATRVVNKTGAFAGITWKSGDMIYVSNWSDVSGTDNAWFLVDHDNGTNDDHNVVLETQAQQTNTLSTGDGTVDCSVTDSTYGESTALRIGREFQVRLPDYTVTAASSMAQIARDMQTALQDEGLINMLCVWVPESSGGHFQITAPYRSLEGAVYQPTAPTSGTDISASPRAFYNGTVTMSTDALGSNPDTAPPEGRWSRVAAPNQPESVPDQDDMPMALLRTAADTFTFAPITWNSRTSGTEISNPIPDIWKDGLKLADMALHRNRLWFLAGDQIVASQDGDLYNLFNEDFDASSDSDPIAATFGVDESPQGVWLVPYRNSLTIFTKAGQQYDMSSPEAFTPNTIAINPTSSISTSLTVAPDRIGRTLYAIASLGDQNAMVEFVYDDFAVATSAANVANHVPDLLPAAIKTVVGHANTGLVFVLPVDGYTINVYRAQFDGNRKTLSSWGTFDFDNTITVIDIAVLGDRLFLLTQANSAGVKEYVIESMPLGREVASTDYGAAAHLDRREEFAAGAGTYNAGTGRTSFTLSVEASGSTVNAYLAEDDTWALNTGSWVYNASPSLVVEIPGDLSAVKVTLGRYYTTKLELSRPYRRGDNGAPQIGDRMVVSEMFVAHLEAGQYVVTSSSPNRTNKTSTFSASGLVDGEGHYRAVVSADPSETTITITDTSPLPLALTGLQYLISPSAGGFR